MERELWDRVYRHVVELGTRHSAKGLRFNVARIALTFLWAVLNDRPISWACDKRHWPDADRNLKLPTPSTMSRRLRSVAVLTLLDQVHHALRDELPETWCKWIDAKPLPVGGCTKDPEAKFGRAAGCKAKGYKLYAIIDSAGGVDAWTIAPMNMSEVEVAVVLLDRMRAEGYVIGDNIYDVNKLYDAANAAGLQLLAPRRKKAKGLGHHRHSPHRMRGIELLEGPFCQSLLFNRAGIERQFGSMGNFAGGLGPLPNWVRNPRRVALWVQGKLLFNAARLIRNKQLAA